jgi:protein translocase SecG subunit
VTTLLAVIFGFVAILIIGVVLLQEGKGGGIAAMGISGMDNIMGGRNPLRKITVVLALLFLLLVFGLNISMTSRSEQAVPEALPEQQQTPTEDRVQGHEHDHDRAADDLHQEETADSAPDAGAGAADTTGDGGTGEIPANGGGEEAPATDGSQESQTAGAGADQSAGNTTDEEVPSE